MKLNMSTLERLKDNWLITQWFFCTKNRVNRHTFTLWIVFETNSLVFCLFACCWCWWWFRPVKSIPSTFSLDKIYKTIFLSLSVCLSVCLYVCFFFNRWSLFMTLSCHLFIHFANAGFRPKTYSHKFHKSIQSKIFFTNPLKSQFEINPFCSLTPTLLRWNSPTFLLQSKYI